MKAVNALYEAQKIAFSPFLFQAVCSMYKLGILDVLYDNKNNLSIDEVAEKTGVSVYGVRVLMEMAEQGGVVDCIDEKYFLTKIGYFLLRDEMTKVNMFFTQDVCYKGLFHLQEAIESGKPAGLKVFGDWKTVYEGLSQLPEDVKKAWFEFDHFYSSNSFDDALEVIFKHQPGKIFDIGGNTGKWAVKCTEYDKDVQIKIIDLPGQLAVAKQKIDQKENNIKNRVEYTAVDMLDPETEVPGGADVYWMSQFLDCFSEQEIEAILLKIKKNMQPDATIFIMETFIDNQRFPAAEYSLTATSLYFTVMANGNSKMYSSSALKYIIEKAGLKCVDEHHLHVDSFHTILEVKLAD